MLTITEAQIQIFNQRAIKIFKKKVVSLLRSNYPSMQTLNSDEINAFVEEGLQLCKKYKIKYEEDIQDFIKMMAIYGRRFDIDQKYPWARQILDNDLDGELKVEMLMEYHEFLQL